MKIQYDKIADALYIYFRKGTVEKTVKMNDRVIVDTNKDGNIIGVEILDASVQMANGKRAANLLQYVRSGVPVEITTGSPVTA